ncbi:MAG: MerR family DNA-binding protein [Kribbellaceae bacterium]
MPATATRRGSAAVEVDGVVHAEGIGHGRGLVHRGAVGRESVGLLPAERTPAGYRVYDDTAVDRLTFIASAKHLGLSLDEIRELLDTRDRGVCASVRDQLLRLVESRIADTDRRIAELSAFSAHLAGVHADLSRPAPTGTCGPNCGCVTAAPAGPVPLTLGRGRDDHDSDLGANEAPGREHLGALS